MPGNLIILALLTILAFLIMGYHSGLEDDAFYLAAIKRNLNPSLFPHDADFFRLQFQATIFDKLIAISARVVHLPLAWVALLWQVAAIFFLLHGCWRIACRCFTQPTAQWAAATTITVLLTLPVSGAAINLADQYLHPRNLATAAILAAIVAVIDRRIWLAGLLLGVAFSIHAIMAAFGVSLCVFLLWSLHGPSPIHAGAKRSFMPVTAALLIPLGWLFEPASDAWRQAAATRSFYHLTSWRWYEWLGVFAPLALLYLFHRFAADIGERDVSVLLALVKAVLYYGAFQMFVALLIMLPPGFERLRPFEPMRYLHLLYLLFFLIGGGLLGRYVLNRHAYRWVLLFLPLSAGMYYAQRLMFPATEHFEWPGAESKNDWLQAFAWIRQNTPTDALFALDPHYVQVPGEDYHGFRALAERSVLADYDKDGGMAARVPRLAPRWLKEVTAQTGWRDFQIEDFRRLKDEFGVNWVILTHSQPRRSNAPEGSDREMACPYENRQLRVCRLY